MWVLIKHTSFSNVYFLGRNYTILWDELLPLLHLRVFNPLQLFLVGYNFQATIYQLWRERNNMRHGEKAMPWARLALLVDKTIRSRLTFLCEQGQVA